MRTRHGGQSMRHAVENGPRRLSPGERTSELNTHIGRRQIALIIVFADVPCYSNAARRTVDLIRFAVSVTTDEHQMAVFAVCEAACEPTFEQQFVKFSRRQKSEGTDEECVGGDAENSFRILFAYAARDSPELWDYHPALDG